MGLLERFFIVFAVSFVALQIRRAFRKGGLYAK